MSYFHSSLPLLPSSVRIPLYYAKGRGAWDMEEGGKGLSHLEAEREEEEEEERRAELVWGDRTCGEEEE